MYIEPTGEIFRGQCEVQTSACKSKEKGVVTKVVSPHESKWINVCNICLNKMVQERTWNIKGAVVKEMKTLLDLAVISEKGIEIAFEIKNWKEKGPEWAQRMKEMAFERRSKLKVNIFILATYEGFYLYTSDDDGTFFDLTDRFKSIANVSSSIQYENLWVTESNEFRLHPDLVALKHEQFKTIIETYLSSYDLTKDLSTNLAALIQNNTIKKDYTF